MTLYTCPLCGHRFLPDARLGCPSCLLQKDCGMICCPACGYSTTDPGRSKVVAWLSGVLGRKPNHEQEETA